MRREGRRGRRWASEVAGERERRRGQKANCKGNIFENTAKEERSAGRLDRENDGAEEAAEDGMRAAGAAGGTKREAET
jgi:uncharacterized Ntn-hydrolase superfamily protein